MGKRMKRELTCNKCSSQFGSSMAKFSTEFAYNLHLQSNKCYSNSQKNVKISKINYFACSVPHNLALLLQNSALGLHTIYTH